MCSRSPDTCSPHRHDQGLADLRDGEGSSVLSVAVHSANHDLAAMVVDAGCVLDGVNDTGDTALHLAVSMHRPVALTLY